MILCIDLKALRKDPYHVQKDVNIEELLKEHTKYFETTEEAYNNHYAPLDFSVCVRSIYDNTVLQVYDGHNFLYYQNMTNTPPVIHKGYDLIMYMTSIGLMHFVDYAKGFDDLMMQHSQFDCIGLFNPAPEIMNPIVVSHVIMSDEGMKYLENFLKRNVSIAPIQAINPVGNLVPILDTLVIVKESDSNE